MSLVLCRGAGSALPLCYTRKCAVGGSVHACMHTKRGVSPKKMFFFYECEPLFGLCVKTGVLVAAHSTRADRNPQKEVQASRARVARGENFGLTGCLYPSTPLWAEDQATPLPPSRIPTPPRGRVTI